MAISHLLLLHLSSKAWVKGLFVQGSKGLPPLTFMVHLSSKFGWRGCCYKGPKESLAASSSKAAKGSLRYCIAIYWSGQVANCFLKGTEGMLFPRSSSLLSCFEILLLVEAWLDSTLGTGYEGVSEVSVIFPISL